MLYLTLFSLSVASQAFINIEGLTDASGKLSLDNTISIAQYEGGRYLVTVALDETFLTDEDTEYPLMAIQSTGYLYAENINDTDINSGSPGTNYASSSTLWIGRISGSTYRSYMQFIFTPALKAAIAPNGILSSNINLYEVSGNTSTFYMTGSIPGNTWTYTSLTWNNAPGTNYGSYNGVSAPPLKTLTYTNALYALDCTSFVRGSLLNYIDDSLYGTVHELRGMRFLLNGESGS